MINLNEVADIARAVFYEELAKQRLTINIPVSHEPNVVQQVDVTFSQIPAALRPIEDIIQTNRDRHE